MNYKYITVHCSATNPSQTTPVDKIRQMHVAKGFSDVGYHYYIRRDGSMEKGRPINLMGAHVKGRNPDNIGVCMEGGVDENGRPEQNFTSAQFSALRWKLIELIGIHGIDEQNILGHRDWFPDINGDGKVDSRDWLKDCPCFSVKQWWKSVTQTSSF